MDPSTGFLIASGVLMIICIVLACCCRNAKQLLDEMWAVDTYEAKELRRMCSGGFDATVEVHGTVTCDAPIVSLAAGVSCCWFHTVVEREDEDTRTITETDSEGHTHTRTETSTSWVRDYDETFSTVFRVEDKTGSTFIDPTRADIDAEEVRSQIVHGREPWFEGVGWSDTNRYRITEHAFLPGGYAYVLGKASARGDGAIIHYPDKGYLDPKKRHFIISRRSEAELSRSKTKTASACFWFSAITFLLAAYCALVAFGTLPRPV